MMKLEVEYFFSLANLNMQSSKNKDKTYYTLWALH